MRSVLEENVRKLYADTYCLVFAADRPYVYLRDVENRSIADLFVLSGVHAVSGREDTTAISEWRVIEAPDQVIYELVVDSSIWDRKVVRFRCFPTRFTHEIEVEGDQALAEVQYFGGYYSGQLRWGSGLFWSGQSFVQGFNPEPNVDEVNTFSPTSGTMIDLQGVPLPGKAGWFLTPPPFSLAFRTNDGWMGMSVEAAPGQNQFSEYRYHGQSSSFYLTLSFDGYTRVNRRYTTPAISFDFAAGPYEVLEAHVQALVKAGHIPIPLLKHKAEWWYQPIYCGWGSQCHLAAVSRGRAPNFATQENYQSFLESMEAQGVHPGTVVIDDKWQLSYGNNEVDRSKWPDLPGFIHSQHARGRKVLLWLKAWDPEGVPVAECITNARGIPIAIDPTNPAFEQRLRNAVRQMLSADGYDADGFKIDFTARIPSGPGLRAYGSQWGLELMRQYLSIIYSEAKAVKPDAFIITHTPHPYLADVTDSIRLNDINVGHDVCAAMSHRARIASIACPEALVDTDNWPITDKQTWRAYMQLEPALGVPALYYATHIDSTGEALDESDYALIREIWATYRRTRNIEQNMASSSLSTLPV